MKALWAIGLVLFFAGSVSFSVSVYRFPEGRFSSGEVPQDRLRPTGEIRSFNWIRSTEENGYQNFWISRNAVSSSLDFSKEALVTVSTPYYRHPFVIAKPAGHFKDLAVARILGREQNWFHVEFKANQGIRRGWIPEHLLQASPHDRGYAMTLSPTPLKKTASADSADILVLPGALRIEPLGLKNSWIKVKYKNKTGWISLYKVLSKLNFATRIQKRGSNTLLDVTSVSGNWFTLSDGAMVSLDQVTALETSPFEFIVDRNAPNISDLPSIGSGHVLGRLAFGEKLRSLQALDVIWVRAGDGEGNAIWYRPTALSPANEASPLLTIKDLQRRGLFDIATAPRNAKVKFASAKGIFRTDDGKHWAPVDFFGSLNAPVAISDLGEIYVGTYVSHDGGRNFSPYLRWDNVFGKIVRARGSLPENLRLIRVACKKEKLRITLGFGRRSLQLSSGDHGLHWTYESEKTPPQASLLPRRAALFANGGHP